MFQEILLKPEKEGRKKLKERKKGRKQASLGPSCPGLSSLQKLLIQRKNAEFPLTQHPPSGPLRSAASPVSAVIWHCHRRGCHIPPVMKARQGLAVWTASSRSSPPLRVVSSWIERRKVQSEKANLTILFDKYLPMCLDKLRIGFKRITPVPEITVIQTILYLLECLLTEKNTPPDSPKELYELYFVFACFWAFGGAMFQDQVTGALET